MARTAQHSVQTTLHTGNAQLDALQGSGTTGAQGGFTLELPSDLMAKAGASGSMQFTVEAGIYGADGQVILLRGTTDAQFVDAHGQPVEDTGVRVTLRSLSGKVAAQ